MAPAASPDTLVRLADAALAMGNRAGAAEYYNRAAAASSNDPRLQVRLGFRLRELGAELEAEAAFRRAIAADLGNADALRGLGITLIARDMPHHAIEYLEEAIAARPDSRAYNAMGVALDMVGERASAQESYNAGLAGDSENLSLLNNLGLSLTLSGRYADAIAVLGRAVQNPNATPRHRQNLALAYGLAGRSDKAAEISNTDLDMRSVRNNLGYYAWLRQQPGNQAEQALGPNFDTAPPTQLADAGMAGETAPATEIAPEPPLARGDTPIFDGALLDSGPVVLTPRSQTGSLHRDSGATGAVPEAPAPRNTQNTQGNVIWELQSIETDDPAAKDTDSTDADADSGKKPELKGDTPPGGRSDESAANDGGKSPELVIDMAKNETIVTDSTGPADEYADSTPTQPPAAPKTASPTIRQSENGRRTGAEIAPPATQTAALSPDDTARDEAIDESMLAAAQAGDLPYDAMTIELPIRRDVGTLPKTVVEPDSNFAALARQAESIPPRQAAPPETTDARDREEPTASPEPDESDHDAETGYMASIEAPASPPEPATRPDNADIAGAGGLPADAAAAGPAIEPDGGESDFAPREYPNRNIAADGPPPLPDPASEPAAETAKARPREAPNPPAESSAIGPGGAVPREPVDAGPPAAQAAVNVADAPDHTMVAATDAPEAAEYANPGTETEETTPPETVLARASPPEDATLGARAAIPKAEDNRPPGPRTSAVPRAGARSVVWPPGPGTGSTRLLRSGMSMGLGPPLSAAERGHEGPRQMASAAATGSVGRTLVGSLTPADLDAAVPAAAMVAPDLLPSSGVPAPTYGLAALILAGLLALVWARRRGRTDADGGAPAESGFETEPGADSRGG